MSHFHEASCSASTYMVDSKKNTAGHFMFSSVLFLLLGDMYAAKQNKAVFRPLKGA
jgi:hypothetical protein